MKTAELYELYLQHPVVTTDSRNCIAGSIFFALKGDSFNGNAFAAQALEKGCAYAVVDEANTLSTYKYLPSPGTTNAASSTTA